MHDNQPISLLLSYVNGMFLKYISAFLCVASLIIAGCSVPVPPSDAEMIRHFNVNEAAFNGIREVIARCPYGMYYPPYNMQDDTACLRGISTEDRQMLDSLLAAVDCERVFYFGKEAKKEAMTESGWYGHDTTYTSFSIPYFSHGYSVGGTSKDFVYDPGLKDRPAIRMTENGEQNEIYRKSYNDTTLYKRIKGDWYIELSHDN